MCTVTEAIEDDEDPFVRMQLSCETEGGPMLFEWAVEADAPLVDTSWLGRELTLSADASWSVFRGSARWWEQIEQLPECTKYDAPTGLDQSFTIARRH